MKRPLPSLSIDTKATIYTSIFFFVLVGGMVWLFLAIPQAIATKIAPTSTSGKDSQILPALIGLLAFLPSALGGSIRNFFFQMLPFRLPDLVLRLIHSFFVALSFAAVSFLPSLYFSSELIAHNISPISIVVTFFLTSLIWRFSYPLPLSGSGDRAKKVIHEFGYDGRIFDLLEKNYRYAAAQFACQQYNLDFDSAVHLV